MGKIKGGTTNKVFFFVMLLIYLVWSIIPVVHDTIDRAFMFLLVSLLLPIIFSNNIMLKCITNRERKTLILMILFVIWQSIMKIIGESNSAWGTHSEVMLFFFYYLIYLYIKYKFTIDQKIMLVRLVMLIIILGILYYIYMNATGQLLVTYNPDVYEVDLDVIPTIFKTELLFVACTCTMCFFITSFLKEKIFYLLVISGSLFIIYVIGNNATATILYILFLLTAIYLNMRKIKYSVKPANISTLLVTIFFTAVALIIFGDTLILMIANLTEGINPRISHKLMTIYLFAHNSTAIVIDAGNSFVTRLFLMQGSLMTWLDNPLNLLVGVGRDNGFFEESGIGKHSEFIDVFAMYGIIGATFMIAIFSNLYCVIKSKLKPLIASYATFIFFIIVLCGIFNNFIYPQVGAILFCFCFVYFDILSTENKIQ